MKALCIEKGVLSKSQLLQVARQPNEAKMKDLAHRFALGMVNREQARAERNPDKKTAPGRLPLCPSCQRVQAGTAVPQEQRRTQRSHRRLAPHHRNPGSREVKQKSEIRMQKARAGRYELAALSLGVCVAMPQCFHFEPFAVILSEAKDLALSKTHG